MVLDMASYLTCSLPYVVLAQTEKEDSVNMYTLSFEGHLQMGVEEVNISISSHQRLPARPINDMISLGVASERRLVSVNLRMGSV